MIPAPVETQHTQRCTQRKMASVHLKIVKVETPGTHGGFHITELFRATCTVKQFCGALSSEKDHVVCQKKRM